MLEINKIKENKKIVLYKTEGGHLTFVLRKQDHPERNRRGAHWRWNSGRKKDHG